MTGTHATRWSWRFEGWSRRRRVAALLLLVGIAAWGAFAAVAAPIEHVEPPDGKADVDFYSVVVEEMRDGRDYYGVIDTEQAARDFPTTPFVTVREPTLAWFLSSFPESATTVVFFGLGAIAMALALRTFDLTERRRSMWLSMVLASSLVMIIYGGADAKTFHEVWAALLVFIGLLALRLGGGRLSMGVLLFAALIRELVAPIMPILAVLAWRAGRRREAMEWLAVTAVFAAFYGWHIWRVERRVTSVEIESPGWITMRGWPGAADAFGSSSILVVLPAAIVPAVVAVLADSLLQGLQGDHRGGCRYGERPCNRL